MDINVSALNAWLIERIKPICKANPKPLSEYITALVRKDKPLEQLIESCNDQLKVFLQDNTKKFVVDLFQAISDRSYISSTEQSISPDKVIDKREGSEPCDQKKSSSRSHRRRETTNRSSRGHRGSKSRSFSQSSNSSSSSSSGYRKSKSYRNHSRNRPRVHEPTKPNRDHNHGSSRSSYHNSTQATENNSMWQDGLHHHNHHSQHQEMNSWQSYGKGRSNNRSPPKNIISIPITGLNEKKSSKKTCSIYDPENPSLNSFNPTDAVSFSSTENVSQMTYEPSPITPNKDNDNEARSLLVTRIPWHLNDLENLSNHFSQFGKITNIESNFQQSQSKALIEFSSKYEAQAAFRSPEPILSNRFIRVFLWGPNGIKNENGPPNNNNNHPRSNQQNNNFVGAKRKYNQQNAPPTKMVTPSQTKWIRNENSTGNETHDSANDLKASAKRDRRFRLERGKHEASCSDSDYEEDNEKEVFDSNNTNSSCKTDNAWQEQMNKKQAINSIPSRRLSSENEPAKLKVQTDPMEMFKEAKMKYAALQQGEVQRLTLRLKEILEKLDSLKSSDNCLSESDLENKENLKKELIAEAKSIQNEIQEIKEKGITRRKSDSAKGNNQKLKTLNNPAGKKLVRIVNTFMDGQAASKRIEKLDKINTELEELTKMRNELKAKQASLAMGEEEEEKKGQELHHQEETKEMQTTLEQIQKKILLLKRELINLETITPSDMAALSQKYSCKAQTKLDKRPRTLFISNLTLSQIDDYINMTKMNYLHIEDYKTHQPDEADPETVVLEVTYRTRDFAESAMATMSMYLRRSLNMSFIPPKDVKIAQPTIH